MLNRSTNKEGSLYRNRRWGKSVGRGSDGFLFFLSYQSLSEESGNERNEKIVFL